MTDPEALAREIQSNVGGGNWGRRAIAEAIRTYSDAHYRKGFAAGAEQMRERAAERATLASAFILAKEISDLTLALEGQPKLDPKD